MNRFSRTGLSSGRVAVIISVAALVLALAGTAFSGGSAVPGKNGVKASDIAKGAVKEGKLAGGAVTTPKIAGQAVTAGKFFFSSKGTVNFGNINGEACASLTVPVAGITATDHVLVTPPPGFPDTFTLTGRPEPGTSVVTLAACNTFPGGGFVDPDGGGGPYKGAGGALSRSGIG